MERIIIHWTGGTNEPSEKECNCYHYLINGDGLEILGKYKPEDNLNCYDGKYAQHTGGGNTGSIGVAMCGMFVPGNTNVRKTKYPLTAVQVEYMFELVARLCRKYNLQINSDTVMTHYEFGKKHPKTSSAGKIDITYLPPYPKVTATDMGDFIRGKVKWYYKKLYA